MGSSITQSELKSLLLYNKELGIFTRLTSPNGKEKVGDIAGTIEKSGYVSINVSGKSYKAHRLVWLYHIGKFPKKHLDHINNNRLDNRIENLREVTVADNMKNKTKPKHNTSGKTGVIYHKKNKNWCARITVDKVKISLGSFENKEDAIQARLDAEEKYGYTTKEKVVNDSKLRELYNSRTRTTWESKGERTKKSLVGDIYYNQLSNSRSRGHREPEYSKEELYEWLMSQTKFHELFAEWKASGEQKRLIPSVDRKCDDVHYCMNNIQLMTFGENEDKYKADKLANKNIVDQIEVEQYDIDTGELIAVFPSMSEARRITGAKGISSVCSGKRKTAGGYIWRKRRIDGN